MDIVFFNQFHIRNLKHVEACTTTFEFSDFQKMIFQIFASFYCKILVFLV